MKPILLSLIAGLAPVPVIYLFYYRYFSLKKSFSGNLEFFCYGVLLASFIFILGPFVSGAVSTGNGALAVFVRAAVIEKLGAFILICFLLYRHRKGMTAVNAVVSSMLLGLGFAALENVLFAVTIHASVILVRFMSSVTMHVITCGLIGYFIASMMMNGSVLNRAGNLLAALAVPALFHGGYDLLLFFGGRMTYLISALLVVLIMTAEYLLAKSQVLPGTDELNGKKLHLEDWKTMEMEPQFERWIIRSMGAKNREIVPFFSPHLGRLKLAIIAAGALVSAASLIAGDRLALLPTGLTPPETAMLFILFPALYGFNLLAVGIVNPRYFENSIIRIPIIIDAVFTVEVDPAREDDVVDTVTYHITASGSFFKTTAPLRPGTKVKCILYCSRFSSPVFGGEVVWDTRGEPDRFKGTLVRFTSRPPGFWMFLLRYGLFRTMRGITFNLRLPGSRVIRELFVRPVSVMQAVRDFPAGSVVFRQDDPGRNFFLVRKGTVEIQKTLRTGRKVVLETLGKGGIFGEMAILGNRPRLATAVCKTDCVLAVAQADNLDALIASSPEFTGKLIEDLARRLGDTNELMQRSIQRMNRSMDRSGRLMISVMKMLLAASGKPASGTAAVDAGYVAGMLGIEENEAVDLICGIINSGGREELEASIGSRLSSKIIDSFHSLKLDVSKKA